ncbi:hypothetical protein EV714DRAFT_278286 [Schizophyllum commune]
MFIRPFCVASSAPLHSLLKGKALLSLKQRLFVRRATISSVPIHSPLRPSPHRRSPLAVPRRPLPPYAMRQRIAVRQARVSLAPNASPLRPLPLRVPPSPYSVAP